MTDTHTGLVVERVKVKAHDRDDLFRRHQVGPQSGVHGEPVGERVQALGLERSRRARVDATGRGQRLELKVVNEGDEVHDLAVQSGAHTRRLQPGQAQQLDVGVISGNLPELYCTLPGHKVAGMTLDVRVQEA